MLSQREFIVGQEVLGRVKSITNYGAFISIGYRDALLHITNISFTPIKSIKEVLQVGQIIKTKIIAIKSDKISLSIKHLTENPLLSALSKYKIGDTIDGKIVQISNYGIFIELQSGLKGLLHRTELSWLSKRGQLIFDNFKVGDTIKTKIIDMNLDKDNGRISLSLKDLQEDPYKVYASKTPIGYSFKTTIKSILKGSLLVYLEDTDSTDLLGLVFYTNIKNSKSIKILKSFKIGQEVIVSFKGLTETGKLSFEIL